MLMKYREVARRLSLRWMQRRNQKARNRLRDIARRSALESASIQDVLVATDGTDNESHGELKRTLKRIVSMLTRLLGRADVVSEIGEEYNAAGEYEYRDAEYEYEYEHEEPPEPRVFEGRGVVVLQINVDRASSVKSTVPRLKNEATTQPEDY